MAIILARHGTPAARLERTVIQDEDYLQKYIYENPDVLPLDQLQEDIRPLVLVREFPTPSGPIDALATDGDANLYLIETKLYKNRIRVFQSPRRPASRSPTTESDETLFRTSPDAGRGET